tara:strand:+ start:124 stop:447 length:324 start_codon:yes stop_codon:yes gene_type:complete
MKKLLTTIGLGALLGACTPTEGEVTRSVWVDTNRNGGYETLQVQVDGSRAYCIKMPGAMRAEEFKVTPWSLRRGDRVAEPISKMKPCDFTLSGTYDLQGEAYSLRKE